MMSYFLIGTFLILFTSTPSLACNLSPASDWFLPIEKIVPKTDQIFVGEAISVLETCVTDGPVQIGKPVTTSNEGCHVYSFRVLRTIKGSYKPGDIVQVRGRLEKRNSEKVAYGRDCKILVGFNISDKYLILKDAFHPNAFQKVDSITSGVVEKILRSVLTREH